MNINDAMFSIRKLTETVDIMEQAGLTARIVINVDGASWNQLFHAVHNLAHDVRPSPMERDYRHGMPDIVILGGKVTIHYQSELERRVDIGKLFG